VITGQHWYEFGNGIRLFAPMLELGAAPQFLKMWVRIAPNLFGIMANKLPL
jgi:hypothetical protein